VVKASNHPVNPLAERLSELVLADGLRPGDRLPAERALAERLRVSRPALREATTTLAARGILETRRGSGTYLALLDSSDVTAVRLRLEPFAAALAAERADAAVEADLRVRLAELASCVDDAARFARLDADLHAAVAVASGNAVLAGALADLGLLLRFARAQTARDPARREATMGELHAIVDAIAAGDASAAEAAMRRHIESVAAGPPT
jgi:GntR family transcriptional regulator, transcriptional repressor for pyruvate dehydrogenase complex